MGNFSNGTEGFQYMEDYCFKCEHNGDDEESPYCPVWAVHLAYNYCAKSNVSAMLNMLIPRENNGLDNGQCRMFIRKQDELGI